jgi:uncharacterized protein YrzB (UPF0473 family)
MLELGRQGYDVTGLHVDLGIPESSPSARGVVERFCQKYDFPLIVRDMVAEGLPIPEVKAKLRRPICSACGKIKRYFFNQTARELGFTVLATGHNLDDEVARLTSNTLRWDSAYLSDQGPVLEDEDGNEIEFELGDKLVYEGKEYVVLLPLDEDDNGIVILEYQEGGDEEGDLYLDVEDEDVLNAVFDMFKEKYADEFDFVD